METVTRNDVVLCSRCEHSRAKGYQLDEGDEYWEGSNRAEGLNCSLRNAHDLDYDYTNFCYVKPDDYCSWGQLMVDKTE